MIPVENSHVLSAAERAHAHIGQPYNSNSEALCTKIHPKIFFDWKVKPSRNKDFILEVNHPVRKDIKYRVYDYKYRWLLVEETRPNQEAKTYLVYFPSSYTDFLVCNWRSEKEDENE